MPKAVAGGRTSSPTASSAASGERTLPETNSRSRTRRLTSASRRRRSGTVRAASASPTRSSKVPVLSCPLRYALASTRTDRSRCLLDARAGCMAKPSHLPVAAATRSCHRTAGSELVEERLQTPPPGVGRVEVDVVPGVDDSDAQAWVALGHRGGELVWHHALGRAHEQDRTLDALPLLPIRPASRLVERAPQRAGIERGPQRSVALHEPVSPRPRGEAAA